MENKSATIVEKIRSLANKKGMSLPILESELGLGNGTISRWSKSAPNTDKLSKVADFFDVPMDYLLGREDDDTDEDFLILSRNAKKLSPKQRKQLLAVAKVMFEEEFKE